MLAANNLLPEGENIDGTATRDELENYSKIINEKLSGLNKNEEMIDPSLLKEGEEREINGKLYVWNGNNFIPKTT